MTIQLKKHSLITKIEDFVRSKGGHCALPVYILLFYRLCGTFIHGIRFLICPNLNHSMHLPLYIRELHPHF